MPSVEEVWKDPDFVGLPHTEKVKVMQHLDPDFAALPTGEQNKVVVQLSGKGTPVAAQPAQEIAPDGQPVIDVTAAPAGPDLLKALKGGMSVAEAMNTGLIKNADDLDRAKWILKELAPEDKVGGVPQWGRDNPNLYGAMGAGKALGSAVVEGAGATLGTIGGTTLGALSPVPGGAAMGGIAGGGAGFTAGKRLSQLVGLSDEPMDNSAGGIAKDMAIGMAMGALPIAGKAAGAGIRAIPGGDTVMNLAGRTSLSDLGAAIGEKAGLTADRGVAQRVMQEARLADLNLPKLTSELDTEFTKAIRPSVVNTRTATQAGNYADNARTAVKEIVLNKDKLGLMDAEGQPLDTLPQNLQQFRQSIDSTKKAIWQKVESINAAAGQKGAEVPLDSAVNELNSLATKPVYRTMSPETVAYAEKRAAALGQQGAFTVADAQDAITLANQSLKSFYQNPTAESASRAYVDSLVANHLRTGLDTALEEATGSPAASSLRKAYGSLKTIEKDVNNRATVDARKNVKGLVDFADIYTAGELVHALASANPALMAKTGTMAMVKGYIKRMNDPNTHVKNLFKIGEKLVSKAEFEPPKPPQPYFVGTEESQLGDRLAPKPRPLRSLADLAPVKRNVGPENTQNHADLLGSRSQPIAKTDTHPWRQYVAENMSRAMKEEGSHGAAMKKLAQEWGKVKNKLKDERGLVGRDINTVKEPYQGSHRPVTVEGGGATLDDLTPAFGEDIYGPQAAQYYGTGDTALDRLTLSILKSLRGKPDAVVTVYRAIPAGAEASALNPGDWVTVNKKYAKMHGEGALGGEYKIVEQKVKASDLTTNADSFHEQGYYPK